ncbi:X-ray repair cross-complementing protein 5-like [Plakobranchus ocellatus]|uniref:ATP-dependent DNA helicase II subunit 2 n=1 Tax=Plakobranchus ocellatus TaxID=259542 RepID=A0AAV4DKQ0_9GAST|nr:X-ray repair cross-complementing protein 5-like [Plakobranchus ocellatus]
MNQAPPGTVTALESAIEGINMILQRKMFAESKDEVALILFGTPDTDNPLDDGESYQHITLLRPLGLADFDLLQTVQSELQPSDTPGDFLDAIVVALDHLEKALQGKKGFAARRVILFTDLGGPFGDQELDNIVAAMSNTKTELNVIGPSLDEDDDAGDQSNGGGSGAGPSVRKAKTRQQKSGEALIRHMLDQTSGECYSFSEALPALSYFQSRQVKPMAWKCKLEIGNMEIPINGYAKVKDFKLKQTWKKVYAQDTTVTPSNLRTYHMTNEEETEVEKEDMVEGYRYGNTIVPMSEDDKDSMKYKAEKCLKVLGFTKAENFKRHHILGDGVLSVTAEKGDEAAAVALSALINALYETNCVAIARRVYAANSAPRLGALFPHIKAKYECLFWVELPFAEDVRTYTFGSLPLTEDVIVNKKYKPTEEQLSCMDDLITSMDLSQALEDEDGEKEEALKPKITFNPYFQRVYQCLQHRALHPDDPLPDLSPIIANYLNPPDSVMSASAPVIERLQKLFKLEVTDKDKQEQTGENMFKANEEEGPQVKKQRLDNNLEGGLQNMMKAEVTEVGTVTPIDDFKYLLSKPDQNLFEEACRQMQKRIQQVVMDSFGQQFYGKALDCLKALRQTCIDKSGPNNYNEYIKTFKDSLIAKGRRDFWDLIIKEQQGLISKPECEASGVTKKEADEFISEEDKGESSAQPVEEESADDLLDQL